MNYKIICEDKEIEFSNNFPALSFLGDTNRNFYRVNDDIIEIKYLNFKDIKSTEFKSRYKIIFLIIKSAEGRVEYIEDYLKYDNLIIISINDDLKKLKNIVLLKVVNKIINIEFLINIFSNKEILRKIKNKESKVSMIIGEESLKNPISNIVFNILKNFNCIDNYDEYNLYLYSNREFNLQDTAEIEDLFKEYSYKEGVIKISQINDSEIKDNVFYSVLANK